MADVILFLLFTVSCGINDLEVEGKQYLNLIICRLRYLRYNSIQQQFTTKYTAKESSSKSVELEDFSLESTSQRLNIDEQILMNQCTNSAINASLQLSAPLTLLLTVLISDDQYKKFFIDLGMFYLVFY